MAFFLIGNPMRNQNINSVQRSRWMGANFFPLVRKGIFGVVVFAGMVFLGIGEFFGQANHPIRWSDCGVVLNCSLINSRP
jgi:hypothetical protein